MPLVELTRWEMDLGRDWGIALPNLQAFIVVAEGDRGGVVALGGDTVTCGGVVLILVGGVSGHRADVIVGVLIHRRGDLVHLDREAAVRNSSQESMVERSACW